MSLLVICLFVGFLLLLLQVPLALQQVLPCVLWLAAANGSAAATPAVAAAGHHCAQPLHEEILGVPGSLRASLAVYNTQDDIHR